MRGMVGTEFSNVWGEYKNHSNPYIQGTTVPCDRIKPRKERVRYLLVAGRKHLFSDRSLFSGPRAPAITQRDRECTLERSLGL